MQKEITIPATEFYDERTNEFVEVKEQTIVIKHSLVSLSKWEAKWHKPFLSNVQKTWEESIDYVRCMTLTQKVNPLVYNAITPDMFKEINDYIDDPMTARKFREDENRGRRELITSELIYYWMISLGIPMECQKWHLNRLLALIRLCSIKNAPPKKGNTLSSLQQRSALNAARRKAIHSKG